MKCGGNSCKIFRVAETFAGVGGFRIGLNNASKQSPKAKFKTVWSNQWEPATNRQHASEVYRARFGADGHSNVDIARVDTRDIPKHDLLVGGFPCQDYSVARTLNQAAGLQGKKGVLWWEIFRILSDKRHSTPYIFLENVDRLLKSPVSARGRDFAIMLASLAKLGYIVEWRVINAAEYGKPQRRKRIYILGYRKGTKLEKEARDYLLDEKGWLIKDGVIANAFPVDSETSNPQRVAVGTDPAELTEKFQKMFPTGIEFQNAGLMIDGVIHTLHTVPKYTGKRETLGDLLQAEKDVPETYFIPGEQIGEWTYLKGAKKAERKSKKGYSYHYSEGAMAFPDRLDKPSRTIITAEGGSTPSRFKHIIKTPSGRYRRLTPVELEKLCQFPAGHTEMQSITGARRAFFMGNALVVGIIKDMGKALLKRIAAE